MKLPDPLPTDPNELERLYHEYAQNVDEFDEAEFHRLMDARLAAWGVDPHTMTAEQIFGAMNESVNSMLMNLYAAKREAPDDEMTGQMDEIIRMAEQLRVHINEAMKDVPGDTTKSDESHGDASQHLHPPAGAV
jgi:hypothetical protein